jgi:ribosomal protein S18 acetylase RimI-like enzyme
LARLDVQIRHGGAADAAAIAAIVVRAFASYTIALDPPPSALGETPETVATHLATECALVAEHAGRIVGCVLLKQGADLYIGRFAVDPDFHGQGIGRALLAAVDTEARARKVPVVSLAVRIALPHNQRLFRGCGFREVRREAHPGYTQPTFIHMEKVVA